MSSNAGDKRESRRTERSPGLRVENGRSETNQEDDDGVCANEYGRGSPPRYCYAKEKQKEGVECDHLSPEMKRMTGYQVPSGRSENKWGSTHQRPVRMMKAPRVSELLLSPVQT